ncbi:caspase family protein [Streptomyces sp. NPDC058469]|uniref:caspase, EACC1-associated type n=1 Tax=Streptomyces sp. NPDC058469 TaxID=3346514 RepID=UPI003652729F
MGRRLALLIATYDYQDDGLRRLTAPAHDAGAFAAVLQDPDIAGFEVTTLINEPHYRVGEAIADLYRDRRRDDLTLLYFTGHGLKDDDGRLYLAMTNTRRDSLLFTSLPAEQIDQAMSGCTSRQKVLILDCCYSGAFPAGRLAKADTDVHALERFQGRGRTVLTASDATQYSFEGNQPHGTAAQSVFTRYLVEGLRDGSADLDGDGDITLDELYSYVHDRVVDEIPQQRPKKQDNVEGRIIIARNVNWSLPTHLRHSLNSPIAVDRLAALDALDHLYRIGNDLVRQRVTSEYQRLTEDDSRIVSSAANARMQATSPRIPEIPAPQVQETPPTDAPATEPAVEVQTPPAPTQTVALEEMPPTTAALTDDDQTSSAPPGPAAAHSQPVATTHTQLTPPPTGSTPPAGLDEPPGTALGPRPHDGAAWLRPGRWRPGRRRARLITRVVLALVVLAIAGGDGPAIFSVSSVRVGYSSAGVAVSPDGRRAYVTNSSTASGSGLGSVSVIDTATNRTVGRPIVVGYSPAGVAVSWDGRRVYVANDGSGSVSVIDTATNRTIGNPIPVGDTLSAVAVSRDGRVYVTNDGSESVSVIDTATNRTIGNPIPVGKKPRGVAVSRDGRRVYVVNRGPDSDSGLGSVSVIDTATNRTVGRPIVVGHDPVGVAVSPDGRSVYVTNLGPVSGLGSVSVIDTATNRTVGRPIAVGHNPWGVAVSPDGRLAYVTNSGPNLGSVSGLGSVSVIDTATNRTVGRPIVVGDDPLAVAVSRDNRVYVTNWGSGSGAGSLSVITP